MTCYFLVGCPQTLMSIVSYKEQSLSCTHQKHFFSKKTILIRTRAARVGNVVPKDMEYEVKIGTA